MTPADQTRLLAAIDTAKTAAGDRRILVAIAGPPAVGKTTLANKLADKLCLETPARAVAIGMDGFHLDDRLLDARGLRARKGAPDTFDVGGLAALLARLRDNAEPEILCPLFDRSAELSRAAAVAIPRETSIVLVEGNYLLFDTPPWTALRDAFDLRVLLTADEATLRTRLEHRWANLPPELRRAKIEDNDLPNARDVIARSVAPDLSVDI